MINGTLLTAALHGVSTGFPDRVLNIVVTDEGIDDDLRRALYGAITEHANPADRARAMGDALRSFNAPQPLLNECYRAAFYLGPHWAELARNPLFAHFVAGRSNRPLDKWVHYFPIYHRHLERYRDQPIKVLEIGVYRGGGLEMWDWYFGGRASLVGLDIDEDAKLSVAGSYPVVLGDQEDPEVLIALEREHGPFDVIIDDGGHTMGQQIMSAETLFPLLRDGGTYLVEDVHTSYWAEFGGGRRERGTFVRWVEARIDDLHARHDHDIDPGTIWATHLDGLHVYDSVVVMDKKERFRPFNEITGTSSYLYADRTTEVLTSELVATRDAALNDRDRLRDRLLRYEADESEVAANGASPRVVPDELTEELRLARAELSRAQLRISTLQRRADAADSELATTRGQLEENWTQLQALRRTVSWRLTAPLRRVLGTRRGR